MARCRVVSPDTVRLPLSDGDFLLVKKELNAGEYIDSLTEMGAGKALAVVVAYLVSWTLVGVNDTPIAYHLGLSTDERRDVLRSLDVATLVEITQALDAHATANERAIAEKKRTSDLVAVS
jgi:hypothetical protein